MAGIVASPAVVTMAVPAEVATIPAMLRSLGAATVVAIADGDAGAMHRIRIAAGAAGRESGGEPRWDDL